MAYADLSLDDAPAQLALRLSDSSYVRFLQDELDRYLFEALRTWNALTGMAQETPPPIVIPAGTIFVDLPSSLGSGMRDYTILDQELVALMSYQLYEPKSTSAWLGSEMFTLADLAQALAHRRDQFLLETGTRVVRHSPIPDAPGLINRSAEGGIDLATSIIDIKRAAWVDATSGRITPLWSSSNWALRGFSPTWNLGPDLPRVYAFDKRAPISIQLGPPNADAGTLDLITVDRGAALDPSAGVLVGIPDDWTPFIKWGALADLFSKDGPAQDYARSLYCQRMWERGLAAIAGLDIIIDARLNNRIAQFSSLASLDMGIPFWQNKVGNPLILAIAGLNLLAIHPAPLADASLSMTIVRNTPLPNPAPATQDPPNRTSTYLPIGPEYYDAILGYAHHLAMFKVGGQEFAATTHLAQSFFALADAYAGRDGAALVFDANPLHGSGASQQSQSPPQQQGVGRDTGGTLR